MSNLQNNIERIKIASEDIADAIESKGVDVPECSGIEDYAELISQIPTGGISGSMVEWTPEKTSGDPIGTLTIDGVPNILYSNFSGGGGSITVDSELSNTSTNPVQNKAITARIAQLISDIQNDYATKTYVDNQINQISIESGLTAQQVRDIIDSYCLFKVKYSANETPQCVTSNSVIDLSGIQGPTGPIGPAGGTGRGIQTVEQWFKAAPSTPSDVPVGADPSDSSYGWNKNRWTFTLDEDTPNMYSFIRWIYTDSTVEHSGIFLVQMWGAQLNISLQEIADAVEELITDNLNASSERLTAAENKLNSLAETNAQFWANPEQGIVDILTNYEDDSQKSFAEIVVDAQEAKIKQWAAAKTEEGLTVVSSTIDALNAFIGDYVDTEDEDGNRITLGSVLDGVKETIENDVIDQVDETVQAGIQSLGYDEYLSTISKSTLVWWRSAENGDREETSYDYYAWKNKSVAEYWEEYVREQNINQDILGNLLIDIQYYLDTKDFSKPLEITLTSEQSAELPDWNAYRFTISDYETYMESNSGGRWTLDNNIGALSVIRQNLHSIEFIVGDGAKRAGLGIYIPGSDDYSDNKPTEVEDGEPYIILEADKIFLEGVTFLDYLQANVITVTDQLTSSDGSFSFITSKESDGNNPGRASSFNIVIPSKDGNPAHYGYISANYGNHSNGFKLPSDYTISWNNLDSDWDDWKTNIGEDWLKTTNVTANNLAVDAANISGKLTANQINTNGLKAESAEVADSIVVGTPSNQISINGGGIYSSNYISGESGFKIDLEGNSEFNDVTIRGYIKNESEDDYIVTNIRVGNHSAAADIPVGTLFIEID